MDEKMIIEKLEAMELPEDSILVFKSNTILTEKIPDSVIDEITRVAKRLKEKWPKVEVLCVGSDWDIQIYGRKK